MVAHTVDHVIEQGATWDFDFTWADSITNTGTGSSAGTVVNQPKDLTGCRARMQVRCGYGRAVMLEATTENGRIQLGGVEGTVRIELDAASTDAAPLRTFSNGRARVARRARYDLEVIWPDGRVDRVLEGRVFFRPNITRDVAVPAGPAVPVALPAGP